jgi:hypothetical protein
MWGELSMPIEKQERANIQIDAGIVFVNYGEPDEKRLCMTKDGGAFLVTATVRTIKADGGKTHQKGLEWLQSIEARLMVKHKDMSLQALRLALPYADYDEANSRIVCRRSSLGLVPESAYLKNVAMVARTTGGQYKKIMLFNVANRSGINMTAAPKSSGITLLDIFAHWDAEEADNILFTIEDTNQFEV